MKITTNLTEAMLGELDMATAFKNARKFGIVQRGMRVPQQWLQPDGGWGTRTSAMNFSHVQDVLDYIDEHGLASKAMPMPMLN